MAWKEWIWLVGFGVVFVLAPPPLIYFFLFKPEKLVARRGRTMQRHFYSAKWSGKKWTDEEIDAIPGSSSQERYLGAKFSEFVRYAADEPERFPRAIARRRISGIILLLFWVFGTTSFLCVALYEFTRFVP